MEADKVMDFKPSNPETIFGLDKDICIPWIFWCADIQHHCIYLQRNDERQYHHKGQ